MDDIAEDGPDFSFFHIPRWVAKRIVRIRCTFRRVRFLFGHGNSPLPGFMNYTLALCPYRPLRCHRAVRSCLTGFRHTMMEPACSASHHRVGPGLFRSIIIHLGSQFKGWRIGCTDCQENGFRWSPVLEMCQLWETDG